MKFGKRQLVLATLTLALGAAVYLSWILSGDRTLTAANAVAEKLPESSQYGRAQYVNAEESALSSEEVYDIDDVIRELDGEQEIEAASVSPAAAAKIAQARLERTQARDSATELLSSVLSRSDASGEDLRAAADEAAAIADKIVREADIETLIRAKGYEDCVVILSEEGCSVLVAIDREMPNDAILIRDIAANQAKISPDTVKIVPIC